MSVAALIADLVRAGVDPELVGRTAEALATRAPAADEQAERRRDVDRRRKRGGWSDLRLAAFKRDNYRCVYCGADVTSKPQCDHVIPISRGGENLLDNLATSCRACNSRKHARTPSEWMGL